MSVGKWVFTKKKEPKLLFVSIIVSQCLDVSSARNTPYD